MNHFCKAFVFNVVLLIGGKRSEKANVESQTYICGITKSKNKSQNLLIIPVGYDYDYEHCTDNFMYWMWGCRDPVRDCFTTVEKHIQSNNILKFTVEPYTLNHLLVFGSKNEG